ncbi:glycosyltransferase [Aquabacterium sp. J223]|uniref:glycosyltransferase n=1 Tax=Aquabacterium sp. J223 TaxID=2898431 RepID=UPI0021ADA0D2|nr:glycosyltransferase [Aquabacterium sp. J223]UUX94279.1 glycosyltransferase [Aquabacterium sp. J223]
MSPTSSTPIGQAAAGRGGRIHVLQVVGNAIVGGMETYVQRLVRALPKDRFDVTVCCPHEGPFSESLQGLPGVRILVMPMPDDPAWASISSTASYVRSQGVDVIHCHLNNAHLLGGLAGRLTGVPVLFTNHGRQLGSPDLEMHRLGQTHLGVVCQYSQLHALNLGVAPDRLHLIPNGVDCGVFQPRRVRDGALRRRFGIAPEATLIGFIGRLSWEKAPETFLRAMLLVHQTDPEARVVMCGTGPMAEQAAGFVRQFDMQDHVHLAGLQSDMAAVLAELDLVVSSSHTEAMPLALMEAMAAGLPVVGTRVGGVPELVQHGITGYLAGPGDIDAIASCARALLRDPALRERFGGAARSRALQRFSLDDCVARTGELLQRLARQGRFHDADGAEPAANESLVPGLAGRGGKGAHGLGANGLVTGR